MQTNTDNISSKLKKTINQETTSLPIFYPENISKVPTSSFSVDQTLAITNLVSPVPTETFHQPPINSTPEVSNQDQFSGKIPGSLDSSNFFVKDSNQMDQANKYETDFIVDSVTGQKYKKDRVIVRFKTQKDAESSVLYNKIRMAHAKVGAKVKKDFSADGVAGLQVVQLPNGTDIQSAIKEYQSNPDVLYAEPDYVISIAPDQIGAIAQDANPLQILSTPNDPWFTELWGLRNNGQTGGTPGADIKATAAWDISTGSNSVIVAVIDTGVLYAHSDLSTNIWKNPGEIPGNGIDDDHNGYVDDIYGWNFITNTPNPIDDNGHGTHVSGTIGAVGNNAIGVTGINWHTKIMALKAFDSTGSGLTSDAISAILYADRNGALVITNSWSGPDFEQSLYDTIDASPAVVVCAAGNGGQLNNDKQPQYPASYTSANIISVAATDQNDQLASFSHYGPISVDLAAPGVNILSTNITGPTGPYDYKSGTSMATPYVSGVAALVKSLNQSLTAVQIKNIILSTVDEKSSLNGKVSTNGRLNAYRAVVATPPAPPVADFSGTPRTGTAPLTVTFTDFLADVPTRWTWDFGDGNVTGANLRNPVHTYWAGGLYNVTLNATNAGGSNVSTLVGYINVTSPSSRISVFNNGNGVWSIDYNGNNTWDGAPPDKLVGFGAVGDIPVNGDWNSNFKDKIGVFRSPGVWILDANGNYIWDGSTTDKIFGFGAIGDRPVVGEWTRNGTTKIGLFRSPGVWILDYNGNNIFDGTPIDQIIGFGAVGDVPVVGDWNRDGHKEIGVFRSPGVWILDYNANNIFDGTPTDRIIAFGAVGDTPVIGDWNGDGLDEIGLYRSPGVWILDYNGNYGFDGTPTDKIFGFGATGDVPVTGKWN